jgi:hypothetical protein
MDRRKFIQLGALGAAAALPFSHCTDAGGAQPAFLNMTLGKDLVKDIGKLYLKTHPSEASKKKLSALIDGTGTSSQSSVSLKIKDEFNTGKVVLVNGWILSVTEARQSAFYYLNS